MALNIILNINLRGQVWRRINKLSIALKLGAGAIEGLATRSPERLIGGD